MKLIVAANWKMHKIAAETRAFCRELRKREEELGGVEILICPPFTSLAAASAALEGSSIKLGAQNMFWEAKGAFTGEIAPAMLQEFGVSYVILGHSERRHILGESDDAVRRKVEAALRQGLTPLLCIGETEKQRSGGETAHVLERQLRSALEGLEPRDLAGLVVAYEPVWAIGTGKAASPDDAAAAAVLVRQVVKKALGGSFAEALRVQYGGSVNAGNINTFTSLSSINGALVGGASLEAESFAALILAAGGKSA